ncbi:apolipoprotein N-acyltransferase [Robertkochia marina]|uniref:Apolipoprotein N-acyltransferase n=1 Tax=Robertkochia marina TaxID=1227945 RepID=A0A4S3LXZ0_9FLAO|nr:apolipoprotein N-acyltransferase [Robertkochia marina]THD65791.1 apolipoprotein N-acyltransferase [Robertkochia marina]TRZ46524.1 apolipoprotein N-acyltransferase [Robertkochia marina]
MRKLLLLTVLSGVLLGAAWPTYGLALLAFIGFAPLLLMERHIRLDDGKRKGLRVFGYSYLGFLIWNCITTWWIWYSTPFGMFFALLVNTLLMSLVFLLYHFVAGRLPQKIHLVFLPAIWMAFEKFHLNWDFSWPWLNLGNVFSEHISWIQWYEYTGSFGGALWIWLVNIGVYKTLVSYRENKRSSLLAIGIAKQALKIAIPVILSLFLWNHYKEAEQKAEVVIIQPNTDPYTDKYDQPNAEVARSIVEMAAPVTTATTDYIIAPETMLAKNSDINQFDFSREKYILQSFLSRYDSLHLITGADFYQLFPEGDRPSPTANRTQRGNWFEVYNAAVHLNKFGETQNYFKSKLVVGVEHFPFKETLEPILGNVMIDLGGTVLSRATQEDRGVFSSMNGQMVAAPIICYESVYGEYVTDYVKNGANFLSIITNDAWWDRTQGHQQHLSYARLRAVETRRSVARSANTGISALINEKGELLKTLDYGTKGILKGEISINNKKTFYTRYGDFIARIATLLSGFILLFAIARKKG